MTDMWAMELGAVGGPLRLVASALPNPGPGELLIKVAVCGVCRTDLHIVDGEVTAVLPIIPGHEIVGIVAAIGEGVTGFLPGDRIGVPWLGHSCGRCDYCHSGRENLCNTPGFTGCTRDGGFATHAVADANFCFRIPELYSDEEAAPLLCAGLIGWRSLRAAGDGRRLGIYGFGAAAHIIAQIAIWQGREVYAFTRAGDSEGQDFARSLGCVWAGSSDEPAPVKLDAAILFAPVGALIPVALRAIRKGGRVICAGIHMSEIPAFLMLISGASARSLRLQTSPVTMGRAFSRSCKRLASRRLRQPSPSLRPTLLSSAFAQELWSAQPFSFPVSREIINARNDFRMVHGLFARLGAHGNVTECEADRSEP